MAARDLWTAEPSAKFLLPLPSEMSAPISSRILFVGWDAADWQIITPLMEAGLMPTLSGLVDQGVMGNLATLQPVISPMLWTSIATGKTADKHGILGFVEQDPKTLEVRPFPSVSRRTKAIWNIFQQALGWKCNVISWWASHPAEKLHGTTVSNIFFRTKRIGPNKWRVPNDSIHPTELQSEIGPMRVDINELNEYTVLPFIPKAAGIDQKKDHRLERFCKVLSDCCSVQAVATAVMERQPWDFTAVYFDAIDHFAHGFMPYHPPRQSHIPEADFEMYKDVMTGAYRFHDLMLGRLVDLAGPDATIILCSDHGFQSGVLRPFGNPQEPAGPILWHRDFGILVMKGPNIKKDERIYGANLLDITPTLLTLAGLPVARDMDGKPLLQALENPTVPQPIESWDEIAGDSGFAPGDFNWSTSSEEADELMQQFAEIGYIDDPTSDRLKAGEDAKIEGRYNLAQVHLSAGRVDETVEIMEDLVRQRPWESRYIHQLANAYLTAGWYRAAEELLDAAYPPGKETGLVLIVVLMRVKSRLRRGKREGAIYLLGGLMQRMLRHSGIWVTAGWLWVELRRFDEAEKCFRRALELDNDSAAAWQGMSSIHLHRRENDKAIDAALEAVQRLYHLPVAHLNLGIALAREEQFDEAIIAFQRAVQMRPNYIDAHRWLAAIYSNRRPDDFLAGVHRNQAQRLSRERAFNSPSHQKRAEEARPIPEIPPLAERREREAKARPAAKQATTSGRTFILVSGLPRSGTSVMMQMLAAGGLSAQTDGVREADVDNPEGYLEWEAIKKVGQNPSILDAPGLDRKALKVISALLPALPKTHSYRVIYMRRPVKEIVTSQEKMLHHLGKSEKTSDPGQMAEALATHSDKTLKFLRSRPEMFHVLEIDYPQLIAQPDEVAQKVAHFVGPDLLPHPEKLTQAVRRDLYRNKAG